MQPLPGDGGTLASMHRRKCPCRPITTGAYLPQGFHVVWASTLTVCRDAPGASERAAAASMGALSSPSATLQALLQPPDSLEYAQEAIQYTNDRFSSWDDLVDSGPSGTRTTGKGKKKMTLDEEVEHWQGLESDHAAKLARTSAALPDVVHKAQDQLQNLSSKAQKLSLDRHTLADKLANLSTEVQAGGPEGSLLDQVERLHSELARLCVGLEWVKRLEEVVLLSDKALSPACHKPSPLLAIPHYRQLHAKVAELEASLPAGMVLLNVVKDIRDRTWQALKDLLSSALLKAAEALKWPLKVAYHTASPVDRKAFELAFDDLLRFQAQGERIHATDSAIRVTRWQDGIGLYPVQALVQPIALRFKFHFQGSRATNRVDKPEWAFSHILDQVFEHQVFVQDYWQPLVNRAGFSDVDVKSDFTCLLLPLALNLVRSRIPHLLPHPALLAHTIYQTIQFDTAVRNGGFDLPSTWVGRQAERVQQGSVADWNGLTDVVLAEPGWFESWLAGEKRFTEERYDEITSSPNAWAISDIAEGSGDDIESDTKATNSARQIKALVEQVTDRYSPLPSAAHRFPFLSDIQMPLLSAYLKRINASLEAFETLSSSFMRAVPGALAGATHSGVHLDQTRTTGGINGLQRLVKALLSAVAVCDAMGRWGDEIFYLELWADIQADPELNLKTKNLALFPKRRDGEHAEGTIFDGLIGMYHAGIDRTEGLITKHVWFEVEGDLRQYLQRRWDPEPASDEDVHTGPPAALLAPITTLTGHLTHLAGTLPPILLARIYREIINHISNHIMQRAVYAGWSKFTQTGGAHLVSDVKDWQQACVMALGNSSAIKRPEIPWIKLANAAHILALPAEGTRETFPQAMVAAWSDDPALLSGLLRSIGVYGMERADVQAVLRRRVDCWR